MNTAKSLEIMKQGFVDADKYYEAFSAGAFINPATFETLMAVQRIKESWPSLRREIDEQTALKASMDTESLDAIYNIMVVQIAATTVREALEAGARIELPKSKTPSLPPKG